MPDLSPIPSVSDVQDTSSSSICGNGFDFFLNGIQPPCVDIDVDLRMPASSLDVLQLDVGEAINQSNDDHCFAPASTTKLSENIASPRHSRGDERILDEKSPLHVCFGIQLKLKVDKATRRYEHSGVYGKKRNTGQTYLRPGLYDRLFGMTMLELRSSLAVACCAKQFKGAQKALKFIQSVFEGC